MEIKKYDWTYRVEKTKDSYRYEIIPDEKIDLPNILFKLYALNDYAVDSLLNNYVYATHPSQFNDIFDCHEELIKYDDPEFIKNFITNSYEEDSIRKEMLADIEKAGVFIQRNLKEIIYRKLGILSLTGDPQNILMWSYYTNHYGFAIEYDLAKFPFKYHGPFPVNYQKEIEPISLKECRIELAMLLQTNLKYDGWKHENEWRLLIESPGTDMVSPQFEALKKLGGHDRKFPYPIEAIKSVLLGNRFFDPDEIPSIQDKDLHVELKFSIENKSKILDYLAEKGIQTYVAQRNGLMKINYMPCIVKKGSTNKYVLTSTNQEI